MSFAARAQGRISRQRQGHCPVWQSVCRLFQRFLGGCLVSAKAQRGLWARNMRPRGGVESKNFSTTILLLSPSSLHDRPVNQEMGCWGKEYDYIWPAEGENGRLMSQNNHLIGIWMPGSFIDQRGGWRSKVKKAINPANISWNGLFQGWTVLISSFL